MMDADPLLFSTVNLHVDEPVRGQQKRQTRCVSVALVSMWGSFVERLASVLPPEQIVSGQCCRRGGQSCHPPTDSRIVNVDEESK